MPEHRQTPGERIQAELTRLGWKQDDLARVLGRYRPEVTGLVQGTKSVTPELAVGLSAALGGTPEEWLAMEGARQLTLVQTNPEEVARRRRLLEIAPIRAMQKRGWLRATSNHDELEAEVLHFFDINRIEDEPKLTVSPRNPKGAGPLDPIQRAWAFRARQIAKGYPVQPFDSSRADALRARLRKLAAYPDEVRNVPLAAAEFGIRLVVVQPLPGGSIDGAAFWLDEHSPVIALSMRHDRVDWFWFTLCHEVSHVLNGDAWSMDERLVGPDVKPTATDEVEERANREAATTLIPAEKLESFIKRVGPLYSKTRVAQFAHTIKIHPGIIVGQLHHRDEIKPYAHRDVLVKVRERFLTTAITDGWDKSVGTI